MFVAVTNELDAFFISTFSIIASLAYPTKPPKHPDKVEDVEA